MTNHTQFLASTAILSLFASGAYADLTAADTWNSYKSLMGAYGAVAATEVQTGNTLRVTDISMSSDIEGAKSEMTMGGTLTFTEQGDGTVAIGLPASMPITMGVSAPGEEDVSMSMNIAQDGLSIIASGDKNDVSFAITAPSLTYALTKITVGEQAVAGDMNVSMSQMDGNWKAAGTGMKSYTSDYSVAAMTIKGQFAEPGTSNQFAVDATINDMDVRSNGTIPANISELQPEQIFSSGLGVDGDMTYGPVAYKMQVTAEGQTTNVDGSIDSGTFGFAMDREAIKYTTSSTAMDVNGTIPGLPFPPVNVHMDSSNFEFEMPLGQSDEAQDFGMGIALKGFTVSDFLWAMVDPAQQLPRDPANVVLDLAGKANWLVDIFDSEAMANAGPNPGKIESLTLNDLEVTVAGASLTGKGDFTFDNNDLQTFGGMPRPQGAIDLAMSGGITLLDKLTSMNLVPQQQAMGIKMMSGLFAKPGNGPDTLTSRIEIDPTGSILANGQKIQ